MYGVWFQGVIATQLRLYPVGAVAPPIPNQEEVPV